MKADENSIALAISLDGKYINDVQPIVKKSSLICLKAVKNYYCPPKLIVQFDSIVEEDKFLFIQLLNYPKYLGEMALSLRNEPQFMIRAISRVKQNFHNIGDNLKTEKNFWRILVN
jgi:hypothetical protein